LASLENISLGVSVDTIFSEKKINDEVELARWDSLFSRKFGRGLNIYNKNTKRKLYK